MFYPTTYPLPSAWRPHFSQRLRAWLTALTPPPATQILRQAGDGYHLAAGRYRLRVLAGTRWAPGMGLIDADKQDSANTTTDFGSNGWVVRLRKSVTTFIRCRVPSHILMAVRVGGGHPFPTGKPL